MTRTLLSEVLHEHGLVFSRAVMPGYASLFASGKVPDLAAAYCKRHYLVTSEFAWLAGKHLLPDDLDVSAVSAWHSKRGDVVVIVCLGCAEDMVLVQAVVGCPTIVTSWKTTAP